MGGATGRFGHYWSVDFRCRGVLGGKKGGCCPTLLTLRLCVVDGRGVCGRGGEWS